MGVHFKGEVFGQFADKDFINREIPVSDRVVDGCSVVFSQGIHEPEDDRQQQEKAEDDRFFPESYLFLRGKL